MASDMHSIRASAKQALSTMTGALWPGRSLVSGEPARGALSAEDFAALSFLTGALCPSCARPHGIDLGPDTVCAACIARPPVWTRAHAALAYDDVSRIPILALKRAGRRDGLKVMANWMAISGAPSLAAADLIMPVPLHYFRLVKRGYNQSGWLASAISATSGVRVDHTALNRVRATPSQAGLSARARHKNVQGAFRVSKRGRKKIDGKTVILVDDVMTTGATLKAASKALLKAGARQVDILVLARVVKPEEITI
ncbi:MAG: phosphoribosyltransferase family protein [Hyphomonadaceae bacterium]